MSRMLSDGGGGLLHRIGMKAVALTAAVATLAAGFVGANVAYAEQTEGSAVGMPGYTANSSFRVTFPNGRTEYGAYGIGPVTTVDGRYAYCMEADTLYTGVAGTWSDLTDDTSKTVAWIASNNNGNPDDLTQAAIAYLVHMKLDPQGATFMNAFATAGLSNGDWNQVVAKANDLWNDAILNMPRKIEASVEYTTGKKSGTINPGIKNGSGNWTSGLAYTITLTGPAVFDGTNSDVYNGVTSGKEEHIGWHATGNGDVNYRISHKSINGKRLVSSNQDMFSTPKDPGTESKIASFKVENAFQPTIANTQVTSKGVDSGNSIADQVTSGGASWPAGTEVKAKGYYYLTDGSFTRISRNNGESASSYLSRVTARYGAPVATATLTFTGSGQTKTVTAKKADGTDYKTPTGGGTGSWAWVIDKNDQPAATIGQIADDAIHEIGLASETSVIITRPNHDSVVLEQQSGMNKDIMDTITIGGFPTNYGTFKGDNEFGADAKAKIRVWWAGSGTGDRKQDETYKPTTTEEPTADEHHRLLGEWEVPAGNGTYKVGGGVITFRQNNTGTAKTVATGVNISAKDRTRTGYYVFVFDFPGSDRAKAFKSAYNDPWERSFVSQDDTPVNLTSNVSKTEVAQGEEFYDVAHVSGPVTRGSYVTFTAYDAVTGSPNTGAAKLADNIRVNITDAQADNSNVKAFDVIGPKVRTDTIGNVYWQARLYDANGNELASHHLGIENETVIVRGVSVTTKVSDSIVYPGEKFHDTATITGKLPTGAYVTFDAYGPADRYTAGMAKLLNGAKVTIPTAKTANSQWNTSIDIDSPDVTASKAGDVYWVATVHKADGTVLATHEPGATGETVHVLKQGITTHVSQTTVGLGEKFSDKADISGTVQAGDYVLFRAYNPVDGQPDTNAGLLLKDAKITLTAAQATASKTGTVTVTSPETSTGKAGHVYWQAELHAKDGTLLATHALGLPEETVTVVPPSITTNVSDVNVGMDEKFHDSAIVTGRVLKGSSVRFTAYKPVQGAPDAKAGVLYTETVKITDTQALKSGTTPFTVKSGETHTGTPGKVYWMAELLNPDGTVIAKHDLGLPTETVTVRPPVITTHVSSTDVGLGQEFSDKATVTGKVLEGSSIRFTAYNPVDLDPDTKAGVLHTETVKVTAEQAKNSATTPFTVTSKKTSTMTVGNVYWLAELLDPDGKVIARHDLGLPEETVRVTPPKITTQVTRTTAKPGEEFADKATISGKVERGSYVTFTAYKPVPGDPDTTVGKLLDNVKVPISDKDADASAKIDFTVTSPKTKTTESGAVYWQAILYAPDGKEISRHDLGLPSETTFIQPGGIVTSNAQKLGATGEQLYDEITVYDETSAEESADGLVHEGQGNSNPTGVIGRVPQHSTVTVEMYRQSTEDNGDQGMYKIAEKTVTLDTNKMTKIRSDQAGNRPGKITLKVTDPKFRTDKAGMIYWKTTLKTSNGAVLDQHIYGEWNADHKTGYKSYERTPVQKYSTTVSKKWLSDADSKYEDNTLQVYDVLHQTAYEPYNDSYRVGNTAQTPDGATMQFEIWSKDGKNKGKMVQSFDATELPKLNRLGTGNKPDDQHPDAGDDTLDNYQNVKSKTFTLPAGWDASKYYYRVRITVPTTTPGTGTDSTDRNRDVVWYGDYDEEEAFDVIHVDTTSTEPLWVDGMNVSDEITLKGNIPAGLQYEAELWRTSKDGQPRENADKTYDDTDHKGIASEKVDTTGRQDVPAEAIGAHLNGVTFRTKTLTSPGVGSYIWRVRLYSPEQPHDTKNGTGTGGDTSMPAESGVITGEMMAKAGASQYKDDPQGGDHWKQANAKQQGVGDGYPDRWLVFDGKDVDPEKFEVIRISTDVTGTNNIHTYKDEDYVDVTHGADVNDHATITGYMLADYRLGFELYRQATGDNPEDDQKIATISPVSLKDGQKELDSALTHITDPGDYYWVTVFTKPDGTPFQPDNVKEARSDRRVESESFHAVRITTTTAKWTSKGGETKDVALIEGCLPQDAIANFELHDYQTGEKVTETGEVELSKLGYRTCTDGNTSQTVESPTVTVPAARDHYFVEAVRFPNEDWDHGFHRGNDRVSNESTRSIEATTETLVEAMLGDAVSDSTDLENIKYSKTDGKDIRDDLTGPLTASWEVWKQNDGDESHDVKITTLADGDQAIRLEDGQTMIDSPEYRFPQTGIFYYRVVIRDEQGNVIKYGAAREPSETIRIIKAWSKTDDVIEEGAKLVDKVTIEGPVAEGTMISWDILNMDGRDASKDKLVEQWNTPENGAYVITAKDAATALKDGKVTITSPKAYVKGRAGDRPYFVFSLTGPRRDGKTGEPVKPVKDRNGVYTTAHLMSNGLLPIDMDATPGGDNTTDAVEPADPTDQSDQAKVDGDDAKPQTDVTPFYTDVARDPDETSSVIRITTTASTHNATVGDRIHDTAHITGYVPDGYCIRFEYWRQDNGDDVNKDRLVETTGCATVPAGASKVDSAKITAKTEGRFYWRERLIPDRDKDRPTGDVKTITYGRPRVPDETVIVQPLAKTGVTFGGAIGLAGVILAVGAGLTAMTGRRRREPHGRHA
ncbi:hypothetical protein [Bifidobacterium sp. SO1]|uniref:hypothetical protein n=1 Tax=Bifidobacterium sp. SO1 TaxID=2809029 RepID=UPI001BDC5FA2|nr:hypothetical protein [Bifidobacterium sp. SO1]MBT1161816.1 hypothetical protein [Bifidobacterium sp. SO1]